MSTYERRTRSRSTGIPKEFQSPYQIGQLYIENGPGSGKWMPYGVPKDAVQSAPYVTWERTTDENHGKPPYNTGGPFESIKIDRSGFFGSRSVGYGTYYSSVPFTGAGYNGYLKYQGGFIPPDPNLVGISGIDISDKPLLDSLIPSVVTLGSQVWDKLKPQIEQAGLFVALAEIEDIPHMINTTKSAAWEFSKIWTSMGGFNKKVMQPKFIADQFLNLQFGWKPFIKDINQILANVINYTDRIRRLAEENGQWIRRRATLVNNESSVMTNSGTGVKTYPGNVLGGVDWTLFYDPVVPYTEPHWEVWEDKVTFATCVGQFRYWLPEFSGGDFDSDSFMNRVNTARRTLDLFGLRPSPSNIYKAIPWSWLVDWFTGIGRSIQAMQDQVLDQMAAKYMSLSHHVVTTQRFRQFMPFTTQNGGMKIFEFSQSCDVKQRVMADSPFGFYLDYGDLSPNQLAILGALGLSKKRSVRSR